MPKTKEIYGLFEHSQSEHRSIGFGVFWASIWWPLAGGYNALHPADATIVQHNLNAVGVRGALGEKPRHNTLGLFAAGLVLLFHYSHPLTGAYFASIRCEHI